MNSTTIGYLVQAGGFLAFIIGLVFMFDKATFPVIVTGIGAAAFYAGNIIRKRKLTLD